MKDKTLKNRVIPANKNMFKVNNRSSRKSFETCSKLTIKTPEKRHKQTSKQADNQTNKQKNSQEIFQKYVDTKLLQNIHYFLNKW